MSDLCLACISLFYLFISTADSNDIFYQNIELGNTVTMDYSVSFEDVSLVKCGMRCVSYPGCKLFHYGDDKTCYILNMVDKGLDSIDITSLHVDQSLKERCNSQPGYLSLLGGIYCMRASSNKLNWFKAKSTCEEYDGHLLIMKQADLALKLEAIKMLPSSLYWIGLSDLSTEYEMIWVDGSTLDINIWKTNEPNSAYELEDCVLMTSSLNLFDQLCSDSNYFICDFPFGFTF